MGGGSLRADSGACKCVVGIENMWCGGHGWSKQVAGRSKRIAGDMPVLCMGTDT